MLRGGGKTGSVAIDGFADNGTDGGCGKTAVLQKAKTAGALTVVGRRLLAVLAAADLAKQFVPWDIYLGACPLPQRLGNAALAQFGTDAQRPVTLPDATAHERLRESPVADQVLFIESSDCPASGLLIET